MYKGNYNLLGSGEIGEPPIPIEVVTEAGWSQWRAEAGSIANRWVDSTQFFPKKSNICLVPDANGGLERVLVGVGQSTDVWTLAELPGRLPQGSYMVAPGLGSISSLGGLGMGWALGAYQFDQYKAAKRRPGLLVVPDAKELREARILAGAVWLVRDLINTPANDMGPEELAGVADQVAAVGDATVRHISGTDLLDEGYPTIHTVGRASHKEPRLIDLIWGPPEAPKVTLVGKGVCFDSGGLDLKPSENMLLMKKDMGGAAHVLALAKIIMQLNLNVRLRVLIPAVENSVSGSSFRPGDVIKTRSGITVEVGNTDAEGRLILCDALTEASQDAPELIIDMATLTGAARIALGTEIAAMFTNNEALAEDLSVHSTHQQDPLWRMPLWPGYFDDLESRVADYSNVPSHRYGGAISAGLFLQEFVSSGLVWAHFDIMGWNQKGRPGRPVGGEAFAVRALAALLLKRYG
ncbi:MAG: leucyl aminopeptidase family protein [Pseudomonadota bacterium]|nr:leucyl aminopeptidase family protein [Pseudomonadota bacterium]